jgi:methionyl-tRNA synthetase
MSQYYVTTPIYYVNDRPHIGHVYTTTVADAMARYHRLQGDEVFFLTGTDEHAAKVVDAAAERGLTPQVWADQNAAAFRAAFDSQRLEYSDFIRTTEARHRQWVEARIRQLMETGDVYLGEYEGWYDAGQEEYIPEVKAKESDYKSPVNGRPLVRKTEKNYFFRLSAYGDALLALLESGEFAVRPEARKNEVVARIRGGLNDVPISRTGAGDWGIRIPGDPEHTVYVWIDALCNYTSGIDTPDRRCFWRADLQLVGKDILWFHAVIWPTLLLALRKIPGNEWLAPPRQVYAHSFWIREGQKMSKSLGNFITLEVLEELAETFHREGVRYFLLTNGPLGTNDSDFALGKFIDVYNSDLANTLGNCLSRVGNMTGRYFDGKLPSVGPPVEGSEALVARAEEAVAAARAAFERVDPTGAAAAAIGLVSAIDGYIDQTRPFALAKDPARLPEVGTILYHCAEALRIATVLLWPLLPEKIGAVWQRLGCDGYNESLKDRGAGSLEEWGRWGGLQPGTTIEQGAALFRRIDKDKYIKEAASVSEAQEPKQEETPSTTEAPAKAAPSAGAAPSPKKADPDAVETLPPIDIDQFFETELRVAEVKAAERVPKSNKLLKLTLEVGEESRTVVAGIGKAYEPEALVGQKVIVVANLKPAKLMGIESQGMVLAASIDGQPALVQPPAEVPSGVRVR